MKMIQIIEHGMEPTQIAEMLHESLDSPNRITRVTARFKDGVRIVDRSRVQELPPDFECLAQYAAKFWEAIFPNLPEMVWQKEANTLRFEGGWAIQKREDGRHWSLFKFDKPKDWSDVDSVLPLKPPSENPWWKHIETLDLRTRDFKKFLKTIIDTNVDECLNIIAKDFKFPVIPITYPEYSGYTIVPRNGRFVVKLKEHVWMAFEGGAHYPSEMTHYASEFKTKPEAHTAAKTLVGVPETA